MIYLYSTGPQGVHAAEVNAPEFNLKEPAT